MCSSSNFSLKARSWLKYKQAENTGFKKDFLQQFNNTAFSIEWKVLLFQEIFHVLIVRQEFCYSAFVSSDFFLGVWVKMLREWSWNQNCFIVMVTWLVTYGAACSFFILTENKYIK